MNARPHTRCSIGSTTSSRGPSTLRSPPTSSRTMATGCFARSPRGQTQRPSTTRRHTHIAPRVRPTFRSPTPHLRPPAHPTCFPASLPPAGASLAERVGARVAGQVHRGAGAAAGHRVAQARVGAALRGGRRVARLSSAPRPVVAESRADGAAGRAVGGRPSSRRVVDWAERWRRGLSSAKARRARGACGREPAGARGGRSGAGDRLWRRSGAAGGRAARSAARPSPTAAAACGERRRPARVRIEPVPLDVPPQGLRLPAPHAAPLARDDPCCASCVPCTSLSTQRIACVCVWLVALAAACTCAQAAGWCAALAEGDTRSEVRGREIEWRVESIFFQTLSLFES